MGPQKGNAIYIKNPDSQHTQTQHHPASHTVAQTPLTPPPIPPQPKHRHTTHTPPDPTGLVKPRLNPLMQSPSPPTSPRAKHKPISHTPLTLLVPRTTLIPSTSAALDTIPVAPTYSCPALTATTSPRPPHQHCSHPHTLSAYSHPTQTTAHASITAPIT